MSKVKARYNKGWEDIFLILILQSGLITPAPADQLFARCKCC